MAQKNLKMLEKFENILETDPLLQEVRKAIAKIPDNKKSKKKKNKKKKKKRTRMKCSSFICENVESKVGEFKVCSQCSLAYYCSAACQKRHWYAGHKKECERS